MMSGEHICLKEHQWGVMEQNIKTILDNQQKFELTVASHVKEGEKEGGFRDRVRDLEKQGSSLKKAEWARVVVSGLIGGIVARSPELLGVAKYLIGMAFAQGN
jgi:hypothetical protein